MKHITKAQTRQCRTSIETFIRDKTSRGEIAHYDSFPDKDVLRLSLLEEQGYICAYCMRRIENNPLKTKIEHWKSREVYNAEKNHEGTLDYNNLLAVCDGKTSEWEHCDTIRSRKDPKLTINPLDKRLISQISYLRNGKIESPDSNIFKDVEEHLNLNVQILQNNRKKALTDIQKAFDIRCKGKDYSQSEIIKKKIVQQFIERKESHFFEPYWGIIAFIYRKYL